MNEIKTVYHQIGKEYVEGNFKVDKAFLQRAYDEIKRINNEIFERIPFKVIFTDDDTYASAKEMRERVIKEGVIYIYKGGEPNEYLTQEENWKGRAVHDVWAHLVCGCPFNFQGELNAYYEQRKYYPEWTWRVLFAEIPAQTSAFYYSDGFDFEQRAIEAPKHWLELTEKYKRDYSQNSVLKPLIDVLV